MILLDLIVYCPLTYRYTFSMVFFYNSMRKKWKWLFQLTYGLTQSRAGTTDPAFGDWFGSTPYGDDPNDQYWIRAGIDYAKRTGF